MSENHAGVVGTIGRVAETLPPIFLALLVINIIFILGLFWFLDGQQTARNAVLARVLDKCVQQSSTRP